MRRRIPAAILIAAALLIPTLAGAQQKTLRVAAAADLQPVLPAVAASFEKASGIEVLASYASSATLATQILNGAPYDLFLAANRAFPERVVKAGLTTETAPVVYARGQLELWARKGAVLGPLTMQSLRSPSIRHIAIANPVHAPYGAAAMAALKTLGLEKALRPKLVFAENIAQAAQYGQSGNAECALISKTLAIAPVMQAAGLFVPVPGHAYPPIEQGAVAMRNAADKQAALEFLRYLLSPAGQALLGRGGLGPAMPNAANAPAVSNAR